jgi:ubiquinone/menaquinone biosynthesis C-methylase UbiE
MEDIRIINNQQRDYYADREEASVSQLFHYYAPVLNLLKERKSLKIIDLGGGGGNFALALHKYFAGIPCEVFVLDTMSYDTWTSYADKVTFMQGSANNLEKLFKKDMFDLIFANRVFHHFVRASWRKTVRGMLDIMKQIDFVLKSDGYFCITDFFYNGLLHHTASSRIIYELTSATFPPIVSLCKNFEAQSSGVGVCFLSKKMWLSLISKSGLKIENMVESDMEIRLPIYKKICLLNKNIMEDNLFMLRKHDFTPQN